VPTIRLSQQTANSKIFGIGVGSANIPITINAGVSLEIYNSQSFLSSTTFKGDTPTCSTCRLISRNEDIKVLNNSKLRFEAGMTLGIGAAIQPTNLILGDGSSAGHLEIVTNTADPNEWLRVEKMGNSWGFNGFVFEGTAGQKSTASVAGLSIAGYKGTNSSNIFHFKNNYEVINMESISFNQRFYYSNSTDIFFENCASGVFTDADFDNFEFTNHSSNKFSLRSYTLNLDPSTCTTLPGVSEITMTNAKGWGYGSLYENDPNNLITWYNENSLICTWNGSVSSNWKTPANWSNCVNGRGNYPDQFDWVIVSSGTPTPNPIQIQDFVVVQGVHSTGTGSANKITIFEGFGLWLDSGLIQSNMTVTSSPENCNTCDFGSESTSILNDATLTLERGLSLKANSSTEAFNVGDGATPGHLVIDANTNDQTLWSTISPNSYYNGGIKVEGSDGANRSSLLINGLISPFFYNDIGIHLVDHYILNGLDRVIFKSAFGWNRGSDRIRVDNCDNATFADTNWTNIDFFSPPQTGANIAFNNCSSMAPSSISVDYLTGGSNAGYGPEQAQDPDNILNWTPIP
jgi:hypothetical protein